MKYYSPFDIFQKVGGGWVIKAKVSCILRHWGVQLRLAYSWARPAILVALPGKGRRGILLLSPASPAFSKKSRGTLFLAFRGALCMVRGSEFLLGTLSP